MTADTDAPVEAGSPPLPVAPGVRGRTGLGTRRAYRVAGRGGDRRRGPVAGHGVGRHARAADVRRRLELPGGVERRSWPRPGPQLRRCHRVAAGVGDLGGVHRRRGPIAQDLRADHLRSAVDEPALSGRAARVRQRRAAPLALAAGARPDTHPAAGPPDHHLGIQRLWRVHECGADHWLFRSPRPSCRGGATTPCPVRGRVCAPGCRPDGEGGVDRGDPRRGRRSGAGPARPRGRQPVAHGGHGSRLRGGPGGGVGAVPARTDRVPRRLERVLVGAARPRISSRKPDRRIRRVSSTRPRTTSTSSVWRPGSAQRSCSSSWSSRWRWSSSRSSSATALTGSGWLCPAARWRSCWPGSAACTWSGGSSSPPPLRRGCDGS